MAAVLAVKVSHYFRFDLAEIRKWLERRQLADAP